MIRGVAAIAILIVTQAQAQVLVVEPGLNDPMILHFNAAFIRLNNVASISGQASVKRDGEPIRDKSDRSFYSFDRNGSTVFTNNTFGKPGSGRDTASVAWTYDTLGRAIEQLRNDLNGHFAFRDSSDAKGRVVKQVYVRIENLSGDRYNLQRGRETIISEERFTYEDVNDTVLQKTWLNDRGLPYREQFYHTDEWGYLRVIDDHYLITGRRGRVTFRYAEKGRLAERIEQPDLSNPTTTKHIWHYDVAGNVVMGDQYRNEKSIRHIEYLYEASSMFLKATIAKDLETGLIHIMRYTTESR